MTLYNKTKLLDKSSTDNATIITGVNDPMLWASAKVRYLKDKIL